MKKFMSFVLSMLISSVCFAAVDKNTAMKWERELHAAKSSAFDAMILNDPIKRKNTMQSLMKLRDRTEKLFGETDDCSRTAEGLVNVYQNEIELTRGSNNAYITASGLASLAWGAAQSQGACEAKIDAIK